MGRCDVQPPDEQALVCDPVEQFPGGIHDLQLENPARGLRQYEGPSAGSTFKRPEGYFAGKLIMDAGLRGYRVGDAQVSEKHCGFVINRGQATAAEVEELMRRVQEKVEQEFQVRLEPEVRRLGEFS